MPVKIRLTRMGKKKQPTYRVVVADSRTPRDGAYIDQIGRYDPRQDPSLIEIDNDKALDWLQKGAQPTDRARKLLEISGAWTRFRIAKGDIHTISEAPATPTPPPAAPAAIGHEPEIHVVGGDTADEAGEPAPDPAPVPEVVGEAGDVEAAVEEVDEVDEVEVADDAAPEALAAATDGAETEVPAEVLPAEEVPAEEVPAEAAEAADDAGDDREEPA
jgi:small subunit ribosomal protein S16